MASVGGSLTWEADDLEGELFLGAGVGAAGRDRLSQMCRQVEKVYSSVQKKMKRRVLT